MANDVYKHPKPCLTTTGMLLDQMRTTSTNLAENNPLMTSVAVCWCQERWLLLLPPIVESREGWTERRQWRSFSIMCEGNIMWTPNQKTDTGRTRSCQEVGRTQIQRKGKSVGMGLGGEEASLGQAAGDLAWGSSWEWMGVTLAETPNIRGYRGRVAFSYSQVELPVQEGGHQPIHKTIDPKFVLPTRGAGMQMEQRRREWPTSAWINLRPIAWERASPWTLL